MAALAAIPGLIAPWAAHPFEPLKAAALVAVGAALVAVGFQVRRDRVVGLGAALAVWTGLAAGFSPTGAIAWFGSEERLAGAFTYWAGLAVFMSVATHGRSWGRRWNLATAVVAGTAAPALYAGVQARGLDPLVWQTDAASAIGGTLGRSNFLGDYLAMALPVALGLALVSRGPWRLFLAAWSVWLAVVIGLTAARTAWLAGAMGVAVLILTGTGYRPARPGRWAAVAALAGLTLVLAPAVGMGPWNQSSLTARAQIWPLAAERVLLRPLLGYGPDSLAPHFPTLWEGARIDRAHFLPLDLALAIGLPGAAIYGLLAVTVVARALAIRARGRRRWFIAGALGGLSAFWVSGLASFPVAATWLVHWCLLGSLAGVRPDRPPGLPESPGQGRGRLAWRSLVASRIGTGLALGVAVAGLGWSAAAVAYEAESGRALALKAEGRHPEAMAAKTRAARLAPFRPEPRLELAADLLAANGTNASNSLALAEGAVTLLPEDAYVHLAAGSLFELAPALPGGGPDRALAAYTTALELDPRLAAAASALGRLHLDGGRTSDALRALEGALAIDEAHAPAHLFLGDLYLAQGDAGSAAEAYARAVANAPTNWAAYAGHARALCAAGKMEEGRSRLGEGIRASSPGPSPAVLENARRDCLSDPGQGRR